MTDTPPKRPSLVPRQHSSNSNLSSSAQARPKTHLVGKKNRSSGQLTKLAKTHSAKNLAKLNSKPHSKIKRNTSHGKLKLDLDLDLGSDEANDGWVEDESSTATSGAKDIGLGAEMKRSVTEPVLTLTVPIQAEDTGDHQGEEVKADDEHLQTVEQHPKHPTSPSHSTLRAPNQPHNTPRMLNRNVSFAADPEITRIPPATATTAQENTAQTPEVDQAQEIQPLETIHAGETSTTREAIDLPSRPHPKFDKLRDVDDFHSSSEDDDDSTKHVRSRHKHKPKERGSEARKLTAKHSERMPVPGRGRKDKLVASGETLSSFEQGQGFSDGHSSPEREPLPAATQDPDPVTDELAAQRQLVQDPPMSRTQYRLNLERLHAMTFREPRQRPTELRGHEGIYGDRRAREVDPLTGKVSIARVCREARRELKVVRARGRDPLGEAIDIVLKDVPPRAARPKGKEVPKSAQKKTTLASGKRTGPIGKQIESKEALPWTHQDRMRLVEEFGTHCKRLWDTPIQYSGGE